MMRPRIVTIEGNIGAGKTTLVNLLKEKYKNDDRIVFLEEPVDTWEKITQDGKNILELFYENQQKYSFPFQILAYTTRLQLLKNEIKRAMENSNIKTIVMERSLEADRNIFAKMLYDNGMIEPSMFQIYTKMSDDGLREYSADAIIWLDTDPEACFARIKTRNREGEESISKKYLDRLDIYHQEWLSADTGFVFRTSTNESEHLEWDKLDKYMIH